MIVRVRVRFWVRVRVKVRVRFEIRVRVRVVVFTLFHNLICMFTLLYGYPSFWYRFVLSGRIIFFD